MQENSPRYDRSGLKKPHNYYTVDDEYLISEYLRSILEGGRHVRRRQDIDVLFISGSDCPEPVHGTPKSMRRCLKEQSLYLIVEE
jgi:hypothetical protein